LKWKLIFYSSKKISKNDADDHGIASQARFVKDELFIAAARALSDCSPARKDPNASLYPEIEGVREVAHRVALAVGKAAMQVGVAEPTSEEELERRITAMMWRPQYLRLKHKGGDAC
jgi:malate dehydrogenase (oxaloacetate-decarboxylating)